MPTKLEAAAMRIRHINNITTTLYTPLQTVTNQTLYTQISTNQTSTSRQERTGHSITVLGAYQLNPHV